MSVRLLPPVRAVGSLRWLSFLYARRTACRVRKIKRSRFKREVVNRRGIRFAGPFPDIASVGESPEAAAK